MDLHSGSETIKRFIPEPEIFKATTWLTSLLVVFLMSQAYSRYMSGITLIYQMHGGLLDAASLLNTFTRCSKADDNAKNEFLHSTIRLFSLLFVSCLADLESREEDALPSS